MPSGSSISSKYCDGPVPADADNPEEATKSVHVTAVLLGPHGLEADHVPSRCRLCGAERRGGRAHAVLAQYRADAEHSQKP